MATIALNDRGTLILPVRRPQGLPEQLTLGGIQLVVKAELHVTVFNYPIGKLIKKASKADPSLVAAIEETARAFTWELTPTGELVHLVQGAPRPLQTVVALLDAPAIGAFFAAVRAKVTGDVDLAAALALPPPPHVTLFTSDPEGKAGIGLNTSAALEEARARGLRGETDGLAAHAVPASALVFAAAPLLLSE